MNKLKENNIGSQVHYIPIYRQPYYQKLNFQKKHYPETEKYYSEILSIPLYPSLTNNEIKKVVSNLVF